MMLTWDEVKARSLATTDSMISSMARNHALLMHIAPTVRHIDDLIHLGWSEASQHVADEWLTQPGPWIIEGVAVARALRKWRDAHPGEPPPVDEIYYLKHPYVALTPGQAAMAKGIETVWQEIRDWLCNGALVSQYGAVRCEHPGYNGVAKLE